MKYLSRSCPKSFVNQILLEFHIFKNIRITNFRGPNFVDWLLDHWLERFVFIAVMLLQLFYCSEWLSLVFRSDCIYHSFDNNGLNLLCICFSVY